MMLFDATIRGEGGSLHECPHLDENGYGFLFPDLRCEAWEPRKGDPSDEIYRLSNDLYGPSAPNSAIPAGYSFFGQFIAHDLTFGVIPFSSIPNERTPHFDLDSVYLGGPRVDSFLYDLALSRSFVLGRNEFGEKDLPRNDDRSISSASHVNRRRSALIGDARNDENVVLSQLHLAMMLLHNRFIDARFAFDEARRLTRWCYQHAMLDFLRLVCGKTLVDEVLGANGRPKLRHFRICAATAFIPFEFALAAFRFGHSQFGKTYELNDALKIAGQRPFLILSDRQGWNDRNAVARSNIEGQRALPKMWTVQWDRFVGPNAQPSQRIDTELAEPFRTLPLFPEPGGDARERSLAYRTLYRGWCAGLPSGQRVARYMGMNPIPSKHPNEEDPLWIYILWEARKHSMGVRLGPVGARIAAEVCVGLLAADPESFYSHDPSWTPWSDLARIGIRGSGEFALIDLLSAAGVPITFAQWERFVPADARRP